MKLNIRWKLILSISLPLMVIYPTMLAWDYYRQSNEANERLREKVVERADFAADLIDSKLDRIKVMLEASATRLSSFREPTTNNIMTMLRIGMRRNNKALGMAIIFEPGGPGNALLLPRNKGKISSSFVFLSQAPETNAWYLRAKEEKKTIWSVPYMELALGDKKVGTKPKPNSNSNLKFPGGKLVISCSAPIMSAIPGEPDQKVVRGVVVVFVDVMMLQNILDKPSRPIRQLPGRARPAAGQSTPNPPVETGNSGFGGFSIIGPDGKLVSHRDVENIQKRSVFDLAEKMDNAQLALLARGALDGGSGVLRVPRLHEVIPGPTPDDHHWIAMSNIPTTGWAFATSIPESSIMGPVKDQLWKRAGFLMLALVMVLLVVTIASIRMCRPLECLAGAVGQVASGDLGAQVDGAHGRDEIGRLAEGFNYMTDQLKDHVAALTLETAAREKVDSELRIARQIQTDLLPKTFPPFPGRKEFDLSASNVPARHVAGDFFDFFFTPDSVLTLVIADVSGKGVPAALLMAVTRTIVRNLANASHSPLEIIRRANEMLVEDSSAGMFVTMFVCQYHPDTGELCYVNAGHPLPYRLNSDTGEVNVFGETTAPLVGVESESDIWQFSQVNEKLAKGESLLLFTDGVTEAHDPDNMMFGTEGLVSLLENAKNIPWNDLCNYIVEHLDEYQQGLLADDVTLLMLRRNL